MSTVTISSELLEGLDKIAAARGRSRDELLALAVSRLIDEQNLEAEEMPDWHVPLVREGIRQADRGQTVEFSPEQIIAKAHARRS